MHRLRIPALGLMLVLSLAIVGCGAAATPTATPGATIGSPAAAPTLLPEATSSPSAVPTQVTAPTTGPSASPTTAATSAAGTPVPSAGITPGPTRSATATSNSTPSSGATGTASANCNRSVFISDVTMPDRTAVAPGQLFTKTWRLRNSGTCAWSTGYELVFFQGTSMANATAIPVPVTQPGATIDLSVPMTAPTAPGIHSGFWRLRAPNGTFFGSTVWVTVNTVASVSPSATRTP